MNEYLEDSAIIQLHRTVFSDSQKGSELSSFGKIGWIGSVEKPSTTKESWELEENIKWTWYTIRIIPITLESRFWNDPLSHFIMTVTLAQNDSIVDQTWGSRSQLQKALDSFLGAPHYLVVETVQ